MLCSLLPQHYYPQEQPDGKEPTGLPHRTSSNCKNSSCFTPKPPNPTISDHSKTSGVYRDRQVQWSRISFSEVNRIITNIQLKSGSIDQPRRSVCPVSYHLSDDSADVVGVVMVWVHFRRVTPWLHLHLACHFCWDHVTQKLRSVQSLLNIHFLIFIFKEREPVYTSW